MADLKIEEETLKKKLAALVEARSKREESKSLIELRKTIEEEEQAAAEEQLEETCAAHERFGGRGERGIDFEILRFGNYLVAFHKPDKAAHETFLKRLPRDGGMPNLSEVGNYVRRCLLAPEGAAFDAISDEFPGAIADIANVLIDLAKGAAKRRRGK